MGTFNGEPNPVILVCTFSGGCIGSPGEAMPFELSVFGSSAVGEFDDSAPLLVIESDIISTINPQTLSIIDANSDSVNDAVIWGRRNGDTSTGRAFVFASTCATHQPCPGDVDGDRTVDVTDLSTVLSSFGMTEGATLADGGLDADGDVDIDDLLQVLSLFGTACL